jgi:hypothetical protein
MSKAITTATPFDLFMQRMRGHQQRLNDGEDPLDVDVAAVVELRKFLNTAGIPLPTDNLLRALSDVLDGGTPAYLNRRKGKRPALTARKLLIGSAAHLLEVMVAGKAFSVADAAQRVADALKVAGFPPPTRAGFTLRAVEDWHAFVVHKAKTTDPARDLFDMQQKVLQRRHPDYRQWSEEQLKVWLANSVRDMACIGFFEATKPG